jgi:mRNA-degrading endonuclease toxin of MazEF toxin-antitoxin module
MAPGEVYLANFPFGDVPGMKLRPVLLLTAELGPVPEVVVAYISSVLPAVPMASDIVLDPQQPEHAGTHLRTVSMLRLHKVATIHATSIVRYLGVLSAVTMVEVADKLRALLNL